jgi:hypothetical protein
MPATTRHRSTRKAIKPIHHGTDVSGSVLGGGVSTTTELVVVVVFAGMGSTMVVADGVEVASVVVDVVVDVVAVIVVVVVMVVVFVAGTVVAGHGRTESTLSGA